MDIRSALLTGVDIPIPECQITLHQPTIKEISFLGEEKFFVGVQCLSLSKTMFVEDKDVLDNINNFQIFMTIMGDKDSHSKKESVVELFTILFPKYKVLFSPQSLIFQGEDGPHIVDSSNFEFLQDMVKTIFCAKNGPMDQQAFNPANDKAKEIAEKLMRGRQRVAAQKGNSNTSVFSRYLSILTIGLNSMSLQDLINTTMFQLYDLMERYSLYINWDLDIRSRLAGGKPDSHPDDWMKEIH